jgi:hypothetical protein
VLKPRFELLADIAQLALRWSRAYGKEALMEVAEMIAEARRQLSQGQEKDAARFLTDAVYQTRDPGVADEIRRLAIEGREHAGRFGKARWEEIIRLAELRRAGVPEGTRPT